MNFQPRNLKTPTLEEFEDGVERATGISNRIQESFVFRLLHKKRTKPAKTSLNRLVGIAMQEVLQEHLKFYIAAVGLPEDSEITIDRILDRIASKSLPAHVIEKMKAIIESYVRSVIEANEGEKFIDIAFEYDESEHVFSNLIAIQISIRNINQYIDRTALHIIEKELSLLEEVFRFLYRLTDTK